MPENKDETERNVKMKNIIYSLKCALLVEHFVGIYRFSIKGGHILPTNWKEKVYGFFLIVANMITTAIFLDLADALDGTSTFEDAIDEVPCVFILVQYVTTLVTTNILVSNIHIEIFTGVADLDTQLFTSTNDEFYRKARVKSDKFLVLLLVSHIIISVTDLAVDDDIDMSEIIFLPLYLIQKIEIVVFCLMIEMLKSRLDILNRFIAKFLEQKEGNKSNPFTVCEVKEETDNTINIIGRLSDSNMKIRDFVLMYNTIGTICSMINKVFNYQLFMTLVSTFVYILITIWTSLFYYRTPENNLGPLITMIIWCLATMMTVVTMCLTCERLQLARNTTKILVNEIAMNYSLPKTMRLQAKAFIEMIEAWPLHILIYNMFSVDITLVLKFISVSTTYLIVIIQVSHFN